MRSEQFLCQALSGLTNIFKDNASICLSGCLKYCTKRVGNKLPTLRSVETAFNERSEVKIKPVSLRDFAIALSWQFS
ncbi:MAG: hypothetical protein IKZ88_10500 [Neisseriaceae bacterium]|nr:hypothetical protein [Neisseriaceae bacterium]